MVVIVDSKEKVNLWSVGWKWIIKIDELKKINDMIDIKIIDESTTYIQKTKHYTLEFNDCQIEVEKWWKDDEEFDEYENDYVILNEDEVREDFTDDEWDCLIEYIATLI